MYRAMIQLSEVKEALLASLTRSSRFLYDCISLSALQCCFSLCTFIYAQHSLGLATAFQLD